MACSKSHLRYTTPAAYKASYFIEVCVICWCDTWHRKLKVSGQEAVSCNGGLKLQKNLSDEQYSSPNVF